MSGGVRLDVDAAERAVREVAARLGAGVERVAAAAIAAADAEMARALRRVSVERGVDPRGCVLVAFGGGGPLHACGLAERLGVRRVLIPPHAGVLSAVGLSLGAERRETLESVMRPVGELDAAAVGALAAAMCERAGPGEVRRWWARVRYRGQGYELEVPFAPADDGRAIEERFAAVHRERFGFTLERPAEVVSARHSASGRPREATLARAAARSAWTSESPRDDGGALDAVVGGRATVALPDATLLVTEGWTARALPIGGWLVERDA
jgi:N-methylhydantoinase A